MRFAQETFGTKTSIQHASKELLTEGLLSLHAFEEQLRFVKGGRKNLPMEFWADTDVSSVKKTLTHLIHGPGDFIERLHDILYNPTLKLKLFGRFRALELYGTVRPAECPPVNSRMVKACVTWVLTFAEFERSGALPASPAYAQKGPR